jgi:hypothetical protein
MLFTFPILQSPETWLLFKRRLRPLMKLKIYAAQVLDDSLVSSSPSHNVKWNSVSKKKALPPTLPVPDLPCLLWLPCSLPLRVEHRLRWRWRIPFSFPSAPQSPPVRCTQGSGNGAACAGQRRWSSARGSRPSAAAPRWRSSHISVSSGKIGILVCPLLEISGDFLWCVIPPYSSSLYLCSSSVA